jgi:hypothetical protein
VKTSITDGPDGERKKETTIKAQAGDPRFLAQILDTLRMEAEVLGIKADKPEETKQAPGVLEVVIKDRKELAEYTEWSSLQKRLTSQETN